MAKRVRIKEPKTVEVRYRRALLALSKRLQADTKELIVPTLIRTEPEYNPDKFTDSYSVDLVRAFDTLRDRYLGVGRQAQIVATEFVEATNTSNRVRFYGSIERAIGIDLSSVIRNEGIEDTLISATKRNTGLITSIPAEYLKQVEQIIFTETTQGSSSQSMIKQLRKVGAKTDDRARLIARDQTAKLNGELNKDRQENLGVEEYIWSTSDDERVRPSHKAHDGKRFRWDTPPPDTGHPGQDIQCRCVAMPIVNL